jgi:hypothetical protein
MKKTIRLTESELISVIKRVISEQIDSETADSAKKIDDFIKIFKGKSVNFYLPGDNSMPIITQFYVSNVTFDESGSSVYLEGKGFSSDNKPMGTMKLTYTCDGTNIFSVDIKKFENNFLNAVAQTFYYDMGIDNKWKKVLAGYVNSKSRTINKVGGDLSKEKDKLFKDLKNNYPRPLVEGGVDQNGKEMINYIQKFLCGFNKSGKAVRKATFASTKNQTNQNIS